MSRSKLEILTGPSYPRWMLRNHKKNEKAPLPRVAVAALPDLGLSSLAFQGPSGDWTFLEATTNRVVCVQPWLPVCESNHFLADANKRFVDVFHLCCNETSCFAERHGQSPLMCLNSRKNVQSPGVLTGRKPAIHATFKHALRPAELRRRITVFIAPGSATRYQELFCGEASRLLKYWVPQTLSCSSGLRPPKLMTCEKATLAERRYNEFFSNLLN